MNASRYQKNQISRAIAKALPPEKPAPTLSNLETLALLVLRDCRPDCFLRRTKNLNGAAIYKLMTSNLNPLTYFNCTVIDGLKAKKIIVLIPTRGSDYHFQLSL